MKDIEDGEIVFCIGRHNSFRDKFGRIQGEAVELKNSLISFDNLYDGELFDIYKIVAGENNPNNQLLECEVE